MTMPDTIDDVDEHPIIFNDWSITRILAGEKTQTRRVIDFSKFDPLGQMDMSPGKFEFEGLKNGRSANFREPNGAAVVHCPYGQPGDVLWVREAFRLPADNDGKETPKEQVQRGVNCWYYEATEEYTFLPGADWGRLRPAIHMPRELCRLRLRVEDVRVERVQEISPSDAHAEGIPRKPRVNGGGEVVGELNPVGGFKKKWDQIHGDGAWERNDWVWVVEFSQIDNA